MSTNADAGQTATRQSQQTYGPQVSANFSSFNTVHGNPYRLSAAGGYSLDGAPAIGLAEFIVLAKKMVAGADADWTFGRLQSLIQAYGTFISEHFVYYSWKPGRLYHQDEPAPPKTDEDIRVAAAGDAARTAEGFVKPMTFGMGIVCLILTGGGILAGLEASVQIPNFLLRVGGTGMSMADMMKANYTSGSAHAAMVASYCTTARCTATQGAFFKHDSTVPSAMRTFVAQIVAAAK